MRPRRSLPCLVLATSLLAGPAGARADGAFPDSLGIFLPADRPHELLVATNFGLLVSEDDGATWQWVCEEAIGPYAAPYQLGPAPDDRVMAVHYQGLAVSADRGCTWQQAEGPFESLNDVFPDPSDPAHVLVIGHAAPAEGEPTTGALLESSDGGETFGAPTLLTPAGAYLAGVEVARSDPGVTVLSMYGDPPGHAVLLRSADGGEWERIDLTPSLGAPVARIIAIHPTDPDLLYLRLQDGGGRDQLALYDHGAGEGRIALQLDTLMTAFLLRSDDALIVGAGDGGAFISTDDGQTFTAWPNAPRLRALGERDGRLYAVADNFQDGFAVGVSDDLGETWQPLVRFDQIGGPLQCGDIPTTCAVPWQSLVSLFGIGQGDDDDDDHAGGESGGGGGCSVAGGPGDQPTSPAPLLAAALFVAAASRRRR